MKQGKPDASTFLGIYSQERDFQADLDSERGRRKYHHRGSSCYLLKSEHAHTECKTFWYGSGTRSLKGLALRDELLWTVPL